MYEDPLQVMTLNEEEAHERRDRSVEGSDTLYATDVFPRVSPKPIAKRDIHDSEKNFEDVGEGIFLSRDIIVA